MLKSAFVALALVLLAACAPTISTPVEPPGPNVAACTAQGGTVRPICRMQNLACVIPYADAGKLCSDKADCQGRCLYTGGRPLDPSAKIAGRCQANSDPCGCFTTVEKGQVGPGLCVD